jgi:hypothetical protein
MRPFFPGDVSTRASSDAAEKAELPASADETAITHASTASA